MNLSGIQTSRQRTPVRQLAIEVCGCMDDACTQSIVTLLRKYHSRYSSILRTVLTLFSVSLSEDEIFGDSTTGKLGLVSAPLFAVSTGFGFPIVSRFHSGSAVLEADMVHQSTTQFEEFMKYGFFPHVVTHNFLRCCEDEQTLLSSQDASQLLLRHYVHESSRTGSFLVADLEDKSAALIDPQLDTTPYETDLEKFHLTLEAIFITHCFVDIQSGASELKRMFPAARVISGLPLSCAGTTTTLTLSKRILLTAVALPSFSPESIVVELRVQGTLVTLFTGTAWNTDSPPRADFYSSFPLTSFIGQTKKDALIIYESLRNHFRDRYFNNLELPSHLRDRVLLLPSHGGYSNVTRQLDLHWGCYLGDVIRSRHARTGLDLLDAFEDYYNVYLSPTVPLPSPPLFHAVRAANLDSLCRILHESGTLPTSDKAVFPSAPPSEPFFLDCREGIDYHRLHLKGSVCVPMSFPADAFGAKRAELWLQCLLLPKQVVVVLCADSSQRTAIKRRLATVAVGIDAHIFTLSELLSEVPPFPASCHRADAAYGGGHFFTALCPSELPLTVASTLFWVQYNEPLLRLQEHHQLKAVEPRKSSVVVDVRTPYEFRNGSHQYSVHFSLSELCIMCAEDHVQLDGAPKNSFSSLLLSSLKQKFYSVTANDPALAKYIPETSRRNPVGWKEIIFYCAAGYRSIISSSIFRRAFEQCNHENGAWPYELGIRISDVPGGALQLMTQRPDLWQVKDRSIICIS